MPTYEYLCQACRHRFETWQKMTDEPLTTCPECGGSIRRVVYAAGVVFKGSGFYKTDYNGRSTPSSNGTEKSEGQKKESSSSESASSSGSSTSGSESKVATTSSSESK